MRVRKFDGCSWGVRTIRKGGRVLYGRRWWKLNDRHMPYDGRLDGKKALLAGYERYEQMGGRPMLELHSCPPDAWPGDNCVNGVFVWDVFYLDEEEPEWFPNEGDRTWWRERHGY